MNASGMSVSVLLACWNAEEFVGDAVRSVLEQQPPPFQIVAVDDGSTDRSADILEGFGHQLLLIRQENRGVGAALNRAAAEAKGEALAFIDADDLWTPGKLARQTEALATDPDLDAVFGYMETFATSESIRTGNVSIPNMPEPAFTKNGILIRRSSFERLGRFDEARRNADFIDWYARALTKGFTWRLLPDVVCWRRIHAHNMGRVDKARQRRDYLLTMKAFLDAKRTHDGQAT